MRRREILTGAAALAIAAGLPRAADAQAFVGAKRALLGAVPSWVLHGAKIDLDFANNRYYGGTLASLLSVSRASTGYAKDSAGNLVAFGVNTLRRTDLGLLPEEARINLLVQSGDFTQVGAGKWHTGNLAANPSATISPLTGWSPLYLIVADTTNTNKSFYQGPITAAAGTYAVSVLAKAGGYSWLGLSFGNGANNDGAFFNLSTGAIGTVRAGVTATMSQMGASGVYRCTISASVALNSGYAQIEPHSADNQISWTADGTNGIYAGNAQFELGASSLSYIPTTTAATARAADNITAASTLLTLLNLPGTVGPVSVFAQTYQMLHASSNTAIIGSGGARQLLALNSNTGLSMSEYNGSVNLGANLGSGNFQTGVAKTAVAWDAAGRSIVANNGTVATDSGSVGSATGAANIGSYGSTTAINGYVQRLTVWNKRLSDAALKALTA